MGWKPEVEVNNRWERNGLVFATKEEAERSASNLFARWTLVTACRAAEVDEPANYRLDENDVLIPVSAKKESASG